MNFCLFFFNFHLYLHTACRYVISCYDVSTRIGSARFRKIILWAKEWLCVLQTTSDATEIDNLGKIGKNAKTSNCTIERNTCYYRCSCIRTVKKKVVQQIFFILLCIPYNKSQQNGLFTRSMYFRFQYLSHKNEHVDMIASSLFALHWYWHLCHYIAMETFSDNIHWSHYPY